MTLLTIIQDIKDIIGVLSPIILGVFAIILAKINSKQNKMSVKQDDIDKKVDGHISNLLKKAEEGDINKGILSEKEHSEIKTDALVDKLVEATKQIPPDEKK